MSDVGFPLSRQEGKRWVVVLLRGLVLAVAAVILCWTLTHRYGLASAGVGAVIGTLLGDRAAGSRLRLPTGLAADLLMLGLGVGLSRGLVGATWPAAWLGAGQALLLGEAVMWLAVGACAAFALRFLAARRPALEILEVVAVASAVAAGFASHRDGMVHRPLTVGDWAWSRGLDPALVFLLLGGLGTLLLAALLVREGRLRRLPLHFAGLLLVALALVVFVRFEGLPKPDPAADLGLTGEPEEGEGEAEDASGEASGDGEGGQGQRHDLGDLEFKDDYGDAGEQAPIAVVLLHDDYSPPPGVYYFRQSAFSQFNGRRLVQATRDDVDLDIVRRFPFRAMKIESAPPASGGRKSLITTVGLMVDHVRPFALDAPAVLEPAPNPNPMRFQRMFKVRSHVQELPYENLLGRLPGDPRWASEVWRHYTEPPTDERYEALANTLVEGLRPQYRNDPLAQALTIKSHLDANGIYSRRSRHAAAEDPAGSFLFGDLTGYCVHFAHAATYLFRSLGIPARVAAGYAVSEGDRGSGSAVLIQGGSAHAWPEIYLQDIGWVVVDPTPEQSLDEAQPAPDQRLQQMLGEMMRDQGDDDSLADFRQQPFDWQELKRRLLMGSALLMLLAYAVKMYRLWAYVPRSLDMLPRLGYRAVLDRLAEVGCRRRFGESREAFARRMKSICPSLEPLTDLHLAADLGSLADLDDERGRRLVRQSVREVSAEFSFWRRLAGRLNPLSWWWVK